MSDRDPEWLTLAELAAKLRVHPETVRRHCQRGRITGAVQVGTTWRIDYTAFREAAASPVVEKPEEPRRRPSPGPGALRLAGARCGL